MSKPSITLNEYLALFGQYGGTDVPYLKEHFQRYVRTKQRFLSHWDRARGTRVLDVGAHWLHQALLYAIDGFDVTALDLPTTFEFDSVQAAAKAHNVRLLPNTDLQDPGALHTIPEDSFDVVLFTEIIEHVTFNPVSMWREIHRVMKPGARIIITTPNFYALRGNGWQGLRFLRGFGAGIETLDILSQKTYAHHWKEYSMRELIYYFCVLSPDFNCVHRAYSEEYRPVSDRPFGRRFAGMVESAIPFVRPDLYLEVELARKNKGIVVEPHW
jgi:2-polyprenyl-6-hydroxyphenyl methylase/3-demethylubiquinone-9 3-methyltransferase